MLLIRVRAATQATLLSETLHIPLKSFYIALSVFTTRPFRVLLLYKCLKCLKKRHTTGIYVACDFFLHDFYANRFDGSAHNSRYKTSTRSRMHIHNTHVIYIRYATVTITFL